MVFSGSVHAWAHQQSWWKVVATLAAEGCTVIIHVPELPDFGKKAELVHPTTRAVIYITECHGHLPWHIEFVARQADIDAVAAKAAENAPEDAGILEAMKRLRDLLTRLQGGGIPDLPGHGGGFGGGPVGDA